MIISGSAMHVRRVALIGLAVVVALSATSCAASSTESVETSVATRTPTPTTTESPAAELEPDTQPAVEYETLEDLRVALVSTGERCDSIVEYDRGNRDHPYGICASDPGWALYVYASTAEVDAITATPDDGIEPGWFLVGTNWMLGTPISGSVEDVQRVQDALGATFWKSNEPFAGR
jgi:hypothetical protein